MLTDDRPRLLDGFSCSGLAADGYRRAGFRVTCLDNDPRALRHAAAAGHEVIEGDAMEYLADADFMSLFAAAHVSPPCQGYSATRRLADGQGKGQGRAVDLVGPVRDLLNIWGGAWVMENVERSPLRDWPGTVRLCGSSFGLKVQRHRLFAPGGGVALMALPCDHSRFDGAYRRSRPPFGKPRPWGVYYAKGDNIPHGGRTVATLEGGHRVMGVTDRRVPWKYLCEGLPPAYTEHIGGFLLAAVEAA